MRSTVLGLLLAFALAGCANVSINTGPSAAPGTSAPTPSFTPCAPGAPGTRTQIQQSSMQPTLEPGDIVLISSAAPALGDIVAFLPPATWTEDPMPFLRRVIGAGGDTIEVRDDGLVYRNGVALVEPYTYATGEGVHEPTEVSPDQTRWAVPDGELFVLGDHRQKSADSRVFGTVSDGNVIGVAAWRCAPTEGPLP